MQLREQLQQLWSGDRAARSEAMRAIVHAGSRHDDAEVLRTLVRALDHNDYEIQEWATVALRQCRNNRSVIEGLWSCFRMEERHSARSCALIALGHLGESLSPEELKALYIERQAHPKDLVVESALRWAGRNDGRVQMLLALRDIQLAEVRLQRRESRLQATIATAVLRRVLRLGLVTGGITKAWLKEHGFADVLDKLRETRG